jgi:hypothetical protein
MYEIILWVCLLTAPNCPSYNAVNHRVMVFPTSSMDECEQLWKDSLNIPDPKGTKSYHKCEAVEEPL